MPIRVGTETDGLLVKMWCLDSKLARTIDLLFGTWDGSPPLLDRSMTASTERDDVGKRVCLFDVSELTYRDNVMDVRISSQFLGRRPAAQTLVLVPA